MKKRGVSSNKAFRNSRRVLKGAGPVFLSAKVLPRQKNREGCGTVHTRSGCDGPIDNNVTYVYDFGSNGNHVSYVECDYVD